MPITVLMAENREKLRRNLRRALSRCEDFVIVGEAGSAAQTLQLAGTDSPDIIIMDVNLPDMNCAAITSKLLKRSPRSRIIAYSTFAYPSLIEDMRRAGVSGFLLKDCSDDALYNLIHNVMREKNGFQVQAMGDNVSAPPKGAISNH